MIISKRAVDSYLKRVDKLDSFTWIKRVERQKLLDHLSRLDVRPKFKTEGWTHQLACHYIGSCYPRFLFLLDMGLGKTKIAADLLVQALREGKTSRGLVCVPRRINLASWAEDLERHSDLDQNIILVEGIEEKRERLLRPRGEVTVIDYAGLHLALSKKLKPKKGKARLIPDPDLMTKARRLYPWVNFDELHMLRHADNLRYDIVDGLAETADFCYGATGTIFNRSPIDIFPQFKLVDRGETFGDDQTLFLGSYFNAKEGYKGVTFEFKRDLTRTLNRMMGHRSLRYDEDEVSDLPPKVHRRIVVDLSPEAEQHYREALEGLINANGKLQDLEAPWIRMRQITSGYLRWNDELGRHMKVFAQNPKLDMLMRLILEAGRKFIVCYQYTPTGQLICDRLKEEGVDHVWFYGGTKDQPGALRRFLTDPDARGFVMQNDTGGTGTNGLQRVARYMFLYEGPTAPLARKQLEKRIHRPEGEGRSFFYDLTCARTVDAGILSSLQEGIDLYEEIMRGGAGRRAGLLRGQT